MKMEQILKEHERLEKKANLGKAINDVVKIIDQLKAAKEQVAAGMGNTAKTALPKSTYSQHCALQTPTTRP